MCGSWLNFYGGPVFKLCVCVKDSLSGCPPIPWETEGDCPAGARAACADANSASPSPAGTAGERGHSCPQYTGQKSKCIVPSTFTLLLYTRICRMWNTLMFDMQCKPKVQNLTSVLLIYLIPCNGLWHILDVIHQRALDAPGSQGLPLVCYEI